MQRLHRLQRLRASANDHTHNERAHARARARRTFDPCFWIAKSRMRIMMVMRTRMFSVITVGSTCHCRCVTRRTRGGSESTRTHASPAE
jgi:hypothetical protein